MTGLLLSDDLIFTSRITGTGSDLGFTIRVARNSEAILKLAVEQIPACVIVDLSNPGLNIVELVLNLKRLDPPPTIVAYGSHVDAATLKAARAAGCDEVMPRSQFVEELAARMPGWMAETKGE